MPKKKGFLQRVMNLSRGFNQSRNCASSFSCTLSGADKELPLWKGGLHFLDEGDMQ